MAHRLCKLAKRFTYVRIKFYDDIGVVFMRAYNKVLSALAVFISISLTAEAASRSDVVTLDNVSAFTEDCVNVFMRNSTVNYKELSNDSKDYFEWTIETPLVAQQCFPSYQYYPVLDKFFNKYPLPLVNKITVNFADRIATFKPRAKGEFEKTADYEASIIREKEEYIRKFGAVKVSAQLYGFVWNNIIGNIFVGDGNLKPVYNPDKEVLTINIKSRSYGFYVPFDIPLSPSDAKKLSSAFDGSGIYGLNPRLTIYVDGDNITMKSLSLIPSEYRQKEYDALGINLKNIPVNEVLKNAFGVKANAMFESNVVKISSSGKK